MDVVTAAHDAAVQMIDTSLCGCTSMEPVLQTIENN